LRSLWESFDGIENGQRFQLAADQSVEGLPVFTDLRVGGATVGSRLNAKFWSMVWF